MLALLRGSPSGFAGVLIRELRKFSNPPKMTGFEKGKKYLTPLTSQKDRGAATSNGASCSRKKLSSREFFATARQKR
ncbi:MAG: hypothetical protein A3G49_00450 [Candidatus Sungbacteria bacterium RIFCSPLOWO2_12_FULL_41_11]|uniref:Uncharacterized protein n=1 Tax=Candidatus Sungbacteria bacterium RIFCSPLOWO2_12_FULL_41_11 TaxID=1802286 RepID=A0A1G2LMC9_9BACT|nr:MAG: hypothetical protein A3D41_00870 [Candidatus Sungbacteria bacterium RIFCSPHIGHO2_02_FULL_41_12b]OHA12778.1 MAG: hypothetical protein A3G49_00450 [Candidatus Sungbacteria bacterium RIFCSPLOWO2_12_FULL_41_11]